MYIIIHIMQHHVAYSDIDWDDPFYERPSDHVVENPSWFTSFCRRIWKMFS
jgi:hypothetical protein